MNRFLSRSRALLRVVALSFGFAGLLASALLPASGCSGNASPSQTDSCSNGFRAEDGSCKPKCDPSKCLAGNVCVKNECRLVCGSHADCFAGAQSCTPTVADDKKKVQVCLSNGHQPPLDIFNRLDIEGKACPFGQKADCTGTSCPNGLECDPTACGGKPTECKLDTDACKGFKACNIGKCGDGTACTFTSCAMNECKGYECLTKGEGDANAYCTKRDCAADSECGPGFYCGVVHDPRDLCGPGTPTCVMQECKGGPNDKLFCSKDSDCQKGNSNFCGKTLEACVDPKTAGPSFSEGSLCLMRKSCLRRNECSPCESNVDCSLGDGDVCVSAGPAKACAHFCKTDANCRKDQQCSPAGSTCAATPRVACTTAADCPIAKDTCEARTACVPRSGGCHAETATDSKFCFSCVTDFDCFKPGEAGTTHFACGVISPEGERGCFDFGFPTKCTADADCPKAPGGAPGRCLDESDGVQSSNGVYKHCYFPRKPLNQGQNTGYSCYP